MASELSATICKERANTIHACIQLESIMHALNVNHDGCMKDQSPVKHAFNMNTLGNDCIKQPHTHLYFNAVHTPLTGRRVASIKESQSYHTGIAHSRSASIQDSGMHRGIAHTTQAFHTVASIPHRHHGVERRMSTPLRAGLVLPASGH